MLKDNIVPSKTDPNLDFQKLTQFLEPFIYNHNEFHRIRKSYKNLAYGEVILPNKQIIPYYPPVYRVYHLKNAIKRVYDNNRLFIVEEKYDGYNVRITAFEENVYAFTRGGFPCPYSTELITKQIKEFLLDHPSMVITAEIIGNNPYNICSPWIYGPEPKIICFDILYKKKKAVRINTRKLLVP
ncbi:MAG: RNA ligase family protein, partial [Candidatus Hodarchaeales archaeon]